jgi:oligoribonuclease
MSQNLVWIDLEMTGLEPHRHVIIEIATIITDGDLNIIAEGPALAVHQSDEALAEMDAWCVENHGKSGLTKRVKESTIDNAAAQAMTLEFIKEHVGERSAPLAGNSVWQDRRFLEKYMPEIDAYLHYRIVDVSSIKELLNRWYPPSYLPSKKKNTHRALDDILESIEELKYYRETIFIKP